MKKILNFILQQKLLLVIIILLAVLSAVDRRFFSFRSLTSIIDHIAVNGIIAAGMTVLLISGCFDLSVGAVLAFTGIISFLLQPYGLFISIVGGLAAGTAIGALNGLLVVKGKINAFIATLGSLIIFRGFGLGLSNSAPIKGQIEAFTLLSHGSFLKISYPIWILIITYIGTWYILKYTKFGRNDYAIGGNVQSARLTGINVELYSFLYFIFVSFTAAVAGLIYSSQVNTASAVFAPGIELYVIAAAVLGGTSLFGGKGGVIGTIQGVIILQIVERAMVVFNVDTNYQLLVRGLVILGVVIADTLISKQQERKVLREEKIK